LAHVKGKHFDMSQFWVVFCNNISLTTNCTFLVCLPVSLSVCMSTITDLRWSNSYYLW